MANEIMDNLFNEIIDPTENKKTEAVNTEEVEEVETDEVETDEAETDKVETDEEKTEISDGEGCDPKVLENAKKELGIGGAAFCDELFATIPSVFRRLKVANKTLHGLFNFAYSYAMDEYVKKNGKVNGGGYWNLAEIAEKYLDPNIKEGFTIKEPKAKSITPAKTQSKKIIEKVAKKAAKDAEKAQLDLFGDLFK